MKPSENGENWNKMKYFIKKSILSTDRTPSIPAKKVLFTLFEEVSESFETNIRYYDYYEAKIQILHFIQWTFKGKTQK